MGFVRQLTALSALGASLLAAMVGMDALAGPLPVPTLNVYLAANETSGSTNVVTHLNVGPLTLTGTQPIFSQQIGVGTNFATIDAGIKIVNVLVSAAEAFTQDLSNGQFNTGNASAYAGFTDSFLVNAGTATVTAQFTFIANGSTSTNSNDVGYSLLNVTTSKFIFSDSRPLGGAFQSLSDYPSSVWKITIPVVNGDIYTLDYLLSVSAAGYCGLSATGVEQCLTSVSDYFHTGGGVMINELDANGAPIPGNPHLIFASGLDYSNFTVATPPDPPTAVMATAGNAQASVSFAAPVNNGGSAITGYTVTSNPAGGVDANDGSTATVHTINTLTNGVAYTFTVTATNAKGTSVPSTPSNSVVPGLVTPPTVSSVVSRRVHGSAGTFDLPLSAVTTNPTTEPRIGPAQTIVFTFDKAITGATAAITEGTAAAAAPTFSGNDVIVGLTGVTNQQYVTVALTNVASSDGGTGGSGSVRIGFLVGDVNQNRVVSLADLGLVNAQLAQLVTVANYLKDVNASGTLSLADKGITNANLTKVLPAP